MNQDLKPICLKSGMGIKKSVVLLFALLVEHCLSQSGCNDGDVRLRGGTEFAGRVEVCENGTWGTICDKGWDHEDARVVCSQLNLSQPSNMSGFGCPAACFGEGTGPVLYRDIHCPSTARSLRNCTNVPVGDGGCNHHSRDAGVVCVITSTSSSEGGVAVGGALGAVVGIMVVLLVGVVTGWIVTCHKLKREQNISLNDSSKERHHINSAFESHSFSGSSVPQPQDGLIIANTLSGDEDLQYSNLYTEKIPDNTPTTPKTSKQSQTTTSSAHEKVVAQDIDEVPLASEEN